MSNIAIIPARGGSKRFTKKNVQNLNGKPLVQYTLEAVANSQKFNTIILSSDDDEILEISKNVPGITPEKRDPDLAGDNIKVIDLVQQIAHRKGYKEKYDLIGLFLPTCPFRTSKHINEGLGILSKEDFSVVSITEMKDPIQLSLTKDENNIINPEAILSPSPLVTGETRSQDFKKILRVNGGFYIAWLEKFLNKDNFFQGQVKGYEMDNLHSVDIDFQLDFEWAEFLLKNNYVQL